MHVWQVGITRLHGLINTQSYTCVVEEIGEPFCKNACRPPSLLHDLDNKTLILVADTFDPASGKSIIHDSVILTGAAIKTTPTDFRGNDKEFCSTPYFCPSQNKLSIAAVSSKKT